MAEDALAAALGPEGPAPLIQWLTDYDKNSIDEDSFSCTRSEFITYFVCYLRNQTESILQTNSSALQILQHQSTPEKLMNQKRQTTDNPDSSGSLSVQTDRCRGESPSKNKKAGRRVKAKLFEADNSPSDNVVSSTPTKTNTSFFPITSPVTPVETSRNSTLSQNTSKERCDTPRLSHRNSRLSGERFSLGDYLTNAPKVNSKKKKGHKSASSDTTHSNTSSSLDLSNSDMFPEIGTKKRIKPTNVSAESTFPSYSACETPTIAFQENSAFRQDKFQPKELSRSFNTERSILKQERHKLMEKFNILNTNSPVKVAVTPQIKVLRHDSVDKVQSYVEADPLKVTRKDNLEILAKIYDVLLKNNLVLSISAEMYFMISIVLSKQNIDDYDNAEINIDKSIYDYLLKTVHNSSYFAIKTLWNQRQILEIMLDKFSLKLLGENKRLRSYSPELAKHLLNLYSLKCEGDATIKDDGVIELENRFPTGVVCFNSETDNVDNFPNMISFQNFKKQRDMFYEILRWWSETHDRNTSTSRTLLRSRVKSLLALSVAPANHAHLATLMMAHILSDCVATSESKLSKLNRRLTGPATQTNVDTYRQPRFTGREELYRDLLLAADNESFRVHFRDCVATELISLDSSSLAGCDEKDATSEVKQDYLSSVKRLRLLAKLLALVTGAPHWERKAPPKETVLKSELARRNYIQPPLDLKSILAASINQNRLTVTIPWLTLYLAMMDYVCLRIKYFNELLDTICLIYASLSKCCHMKNSMVVFLKLCLGWLFELSHFPYEFFYERTEQLLSFNAGGLDTLELIDENVLWEVCPYLREFNVLLLTSQPSNDKESSYRHITPVTMSLNSVDRAKNKERELQARLEQELLRGLATSTRRVLDLVVERVSAATIKELTATVLATVRQRCRRDALAVVNGADDETSTLKQLQRLYSSALTSLHARATEHAVSSVGRRARGALAALLPGGAATAPLETLARRAGVARVGRWIKENWGSVDILCKDLESEMNNLRQLGEHYVPSTPVCAASDSLRVKLTLPEDTFRTVTVSPAEVIIEIKEVICELMSGGAGKQAAGAARRALVCCRPDNVLATTAVRTLVLRMSVELLLVMVSRRPSEVGSILKDLDRLWDESCPNRARNSSEESKTEPVFERDFGEEERIPTPVSDDDGERPTKVIYETEDDTKESGKKSKRDCNDRTPKSKIENGVETSNDLDVSRAENEGDVLEFLNRVLCPRNVVILSNSGVDQGQVWSTMAAVLVFLLKNNYLTEESLTEQCLALYRQDWNQNVLESLSRCMRIVSASRPKVGSRLGLFLDFLSEYCGDMHL